MDTLNHVSTFLHHARGDLVSYGEAHIAFTITFETSMRARSLQHRQSLKDLRRLVALPDLGPWIGDFVLRRSLKITAITGGAALFGSLANAFGFAGPSLKEAATMTLTVGLSLTLLGLILKFSPLFVRKARGIAEAAHMNLLEDVRRCNANIHLGEIWDRVIRYEIAEQPEVLSQEQLCIEAAKAEHLKFIEQWGHLEFNKDFVKEQANTPILSLENPQSKEAFILSAQYTLMHPSPKHLALQHFQSAISIYANFIDGAPFHITDVKLMETGEHDLTINEIRHFAYSCAWGGFWNHLSFFALRTRENWLRLPQKIWFPLFTRAVASEIGRALTKLNHQYHSSRFNSLHLMWPGAENQDWILAIEGCKEHILDLRRQMFTRLFGPQLEGAERILDRMLLPNAEIATEMRYRFDPDYCQGRLDAQLQDDLQTLHCDQAYLNFHNQQCHNKARRLDQFVSFLEKHASDLVVDPCDHQALRLAHHTKAVNFNPSMKKNDVAAFRSKCKAGLYLKPTLQNQLLCIRTYQTLTMISIREYRQHLESLIQS